MALSLEFTNNSSIVQGIQIAFFIGLVFYIRNVRYYLDQLSSCSCAPLQYTSTLSQIESILLVILYIGIAFNLFMLITGYSIQSGIRGMMQSKFGLMGVAGVGILSVLYLLFVLVLYLMFIYNTYEYHKNLLPDCKCINTTYSEMLYIQAVYYGLPIAAAIGGLVVYVTSRVSK